MKNPKVYLEAKALALGPEDGKRLPFRTGVSP
jgi:hypothetical protein